MKEIPLGLAETEGFIALHAQRTNLEARIVAAGKAIIEREKIASTGNFSYRLGDKPALLVEETAGEIKQLAAG